MNSVDSQETRILKAKRLIGPLMYNRMLYRSLLQILNHITLNMKHLTVSSTCIYQAIQVTGISNAIRICCFQH